MRGPPGRGRRRSAINRQPLPKRQIEVTGLTCRRGERWLFENLELSLGSGRALVVTGPNGAGKTTLLMTLAGFIPPEAGRIDIVGRDPEARPGTDIGFLGHQSAVKARLTLVENLSFWAALTGVPDSGIPEALELVGLKPIAHLEAGHLSAGQTRRLALARLIVADRPIWLLDEPTAALDAAGEVLVGRLIGDHLDRGGLVVAATHHPLAIEARHSTLSLALGEVA